MVKDDMLLYSAHTRWYHLLDPKEHHADEVAAYRAALLRGVDGEAKTLLELGSGAGHNAWHLRDTFDITLSDLSPEMLALSKALHPERPHHQGDLRTLRLGETFDTVLVHDAIQYMCSEADLRAAMETAWEHLRPGGAAVFAPDVLKAYFEAGSTLLEADDGSAHLRGVEWCWDPNPDDDTINVEYSLLIRDGDGDDATFTQIHDRHREGLFSEETWRRLLAEVGFVGESFDRPLDEVGEVNQVFLARRPR